MKSNAITLQCIFTSMTSASFEVCGTSQYYETNTPFQLYLNHQWIRQETKFIFSLFQLVPNTMYVVELKRDDTHCVCQFKTDEQSHVINVHEKNIFGNEKEDVTDKIQAIIDAAKRNTRIVFPKGTYLVSNLFLKSYLQIELEAGAVLLGETDRHRYKVLPAYHIYRNKKEICGTWEGEADECFASMFTGIHVHHIKLYGEGMLDENAHHSDWWIQHRVKRIARRPKGIFLNHCHHIAIQGLTIKNTPSWNQHPFFCHHIQYIQLHLESPKDSPTTDGIDPECSHHIAILGCRISVGDDCIAIKSGKIELGRTYKTPSKAIYIRHCLMEFGHAGVTLGSEMSGGVQRIYVTHCVFSHTDRGLRVKTQRGRGKDAIIDSITFQNIRMDNVLCPFVINSFYKAGTDEVDDYRYSELPKEVDERTPYLGSFTFKNITCLDVEWGGASIVGLPEQPIKKITFDSVSFQYKNDAKEGVMAMTPKQNPTTKVGLYLKNIQSVVLRNVLMQGHEGKEVITENVNSLKRTKELDF